VLFQVGVVVSRVDRKRSVSQVGRVTACQPGAQCFCGCNKSNPVIWNCTIRRTEDTNAQDRSARCSVFLACFAYQSEPAGDSAKFRHTHKMVFPFGPCVVEVLERGSCISKYQLLISSGCRVPFAMAYQTAVATVTRTLSGHDAGDGKLWVVNQRCYQDGEPSTIPHMLSH